MNKNNIIRLLLNRSMMVRCGLEMFGDEDFGEQRFNKTITRERRSSDIFGYEDSTPILSVRSRNFRNCSCTIWKIYKGDPGDEELFLTLSPGPGRNLRTRDPHLQPSLPSLFTPFKVIPVDC